MAQLLRFVNHSKYAATLQARRGVVATAQRGPLRMVHTDLSSHGRVKGSDNIACYGPDWECVGGWGESWENIQHSTFNIQLPTSIGS